MPLELHGDTFLSSSPPRSRQLVSIAFVLSRLDYCNAILAGLPKTTIAPLQRAQNAAARLVAQIWPRDHVSNVLRDLHWLPVQQRILCVTFVTRWSCFLTVSVELYELMNLSHPISILFLPIPTRSPCELYPSPFYYPIIHPRPHPIPTQISTFVFHQYVLVTFIITDGKWSTQIEGSFKNHVTLWGAPTLPSRES